MTVFVSIFASDNLSSHFCLFASPHSPGGPQSELSDPDRPSFDSMFHPPDAPGAASSQTKDHGYGFSSDPPGQVDRADDFRAPGTY